jgi:hypothetical protein
MRDGSSTITIDITPIFNTSELERYSEEHQTSSPGEHVSGRLEVLAALAQRIEEIEETYRADKDRFHYLRDAITVRHNEASRDLLSFFGEG